MATVPATFNEQEKKLFRLMVRRMKELKIWHEIDELQVERAVMLTMKAREMELKILDLTDHPDDLIYLQKYTTIVNALNGTLDRLGISNTKRNPLKRNRGKDDSISKQDKEDQARWLQAVK